MSDKIQKRSLATRNLNYSDIEYMRDRTTGPMDHEIPPAIKFQLADSDTVLTAPLRDFMVIGRGGKPGFAQADIDLTPHGAEDNGISRQHAVISVNNGRVSIKDLNSTNGTFLNGYALQPFHSYRLRDSDELRLGKLVIQVMFAGIKVPT
jgi:hypothetical protein